MTKVLLLGGYGNFGKRIAEALVRENIPIIIAGRNKAKAEALAEQFGPTAQAAAIDSSQNIVPHLQSLKPKVLINLCGPYQGSSYDIAEQAIKAGVHYIDLADGRDFVTGITRLNEDAVQNNVSVISGASTVPGLSSAVVEHFAPEFSEIEFMKYGISPGQKAERGLATTQAIMSYVGKPLKPFASIKQPVYGWQDIYRQEYPELGKRWMANCDIPDLDLFPARYGIKKIQFSAGLELTALHLGLWGLSWLVCWGMPISLQKLSAPLLKASNFFNVFGSADGGMHIILKGKDQNGNSHQRSWTIIAKSGDGPYIPTIPAVVLATKLARGQDVKRGAYPCLGVVDLEEYLIALERYRIELFVK